MDKYLFCNRWAYLKTASLSFWSIDLNSGYEEHRPHLSIAFMWLYLLIYLPKWAIQPRRRKVQAKYWDAATVERMGRDWYYDETRRQFGVQMSWDSIRFHYGVQPDCWPGDKTWAWYFPWAKMRHTREAFYGLDGRVVSEINGRDLMQPGGSYEKVKALRDAAPRAVFAFTDFDGTPVKCTTWIEESVYRRGVGIWSWVGYIWPARRSLSMRVEFDREVGYEKGSWKGGLMGNSINLLPGELHEAAFRRYCAAGAPSKSGKSPMTYVGAVPA